MGDLPYFLTPRQVADFLQMSPDAVYALIRTGRLRAADVRTLAAEKVREFALTHRPAPSQVRNALGWNFVGGLPQRRTDV